MLNFWDEFQHVPTMSHGFEIGLKQNMSRNDTASKSNIHMHVATAGPHL